MTVLLADNDVAVITHARRLRIMRELLDALLRYLPGVSLEAAGACARNLALAWGEYGVSDEAVT